ncbi:MAG: anticodon-binding domain-containing protein [Monoraphidium minutum]|nr:MAG: anticodon-binding domain-containing protein [Monoraphidium minutum]
MDAGDWAIGCKVTIRTIFDEEVTGTVFAYDGATQSLVLQQNGSHGGVNNLRLYAKAAIKELLSAEPPGSPPDLFLPAVDKERTRQREEKALRQAEADLAKVGVGVTKEAQSIFDALSKTLPCVWQGRSILVMDAVTVPPPYTPASCAARSGEGGALERIRRVLTAERQRLGLAV